MAHLLEVEDIHKTYDHRKVLNGISFTMAKGETKVIIGPSGTGKSTLLRCVNRLSEPDHGRVILDGVTVLDKTSKKPPKTDLNHIRSQVGMVFQNFNLFAHLTVLGNVSIGLIQVKHMKKKEALERAMQEIGRVGLSDKVNSYPAQLSGGQQQRVSIARALAMDPKLILFDEPTSALDPELIGEVLQVMINLAKGGMTMLCVTHELSFARSVADEIIFLDEGRILAQEAPEKLLANQSHDRIRIFLGKISELYEGEIR
jgi:polar amino acid transport system ATP-binding protein